MPNSSTKPRYGVRLTLPNAPSGPNEIPGLHLILTPDEIVPLETDEDVDRAREIAKTADIEVVDLAKSSSKSGEKD